MGWIKRFQIKRMKKKLKSLHDIRLAGSLLTAEDKHKEIALYFRLAAMFESLQGNKKHPFAREEALACYRAAAMLDSDKALFITGLKLLDEAKLREAMQRGEVFASQRNEEWMHELYEDANGFLLAAEKHQHIQAKRIRGLCYINGWGVAVDKDKGFDLVVESIEQENSWSRVQKIFAELGINQSSFFSELFQHRKNK